MIWKYSPIRSEVNYMTNNQLVCERTTKERMDETLSEKISHAEATLDRIIGFINNSESKTGITLTMVGVMLTILFALSGENIMSMFNKASDDLGLITGAFLLLFCVSLVATLFGIYKLIKVLAPVLDAEERIGGDFENDSKIFFGRISSKNEEYSQYRDKLLNYSPEDYLNDLWSQIYINSKICTIKFDDFNIGLRVAIQVCCHRWQPLWRSVSLFLGDKMACYDFKEGKKRVNELLNQSEENAIRNRVPNDKDFHFDNGYHCWITSIFVDIRDSTALFKGKKSTVSRVIRCFTSEVIEILNTESSMKEIGIRGDCVYGVFSTPNKEDIIDVVEKAAYVNTAVKMLNALFEKKNIGPLAVGIGIATSQDLVVKAGREGSGINSKVWIGGAVVGASNLSKYGNRREYTDKPIVMSPTTYNNVEEIYFQKHGEKMKRWFAPVTLDKCPAYVCDLIMNPMDDWISGGMKN